MERFICRACIILCTKEVFVTCVYYFFSSGYFLVWHVFATVLVGRIFNLLI